MLDGGKYSNVPCKYIVKYSNVPVNIVMYKELNIVMYRKLESTLMETSVR